MARHDDVVAIRRGARKMMLICFTSRALRDDALRAYGDERKILTRSSDAFVERVVVMRVMSSATRYEVLHSASARYGVRDSSHIFRCFHFVSSRTRCHASAAMMPMLLPRCRRRRYAIR